MWLDRSYWFVCKRRGYPLLVRFVVVYRNSHGIGKRSDVVVNDEKKKQNLLGLHPEGDEVEFVDGCR